MSYPDTPLFCCFAAAAETSGGHPWRHLLDAGARRYIGDDRAFFLFFFGRLLTRWLLRVAGVVVIVAGMAVVGMLM